MNNDIIDLLISEGIKIQTNQTGDYIIDKQDFIKALKIYNDKFGKVLASKQDAEVKRLEKYIESHTFDLRRIIDEKSKVINEAINVLKRWD